MNTGSENDPPPDAATTLAAFVGKQGPTFTGPDTVNAAMIRHWCAALGDRNPVYIQDALARQSVHRGIIAPPAMLQAWVMPGFGVTPVANDPLGQFHRLADSLGYTAIVATNCEQEYQRPLRLGDSVRVTKVIDTVSGEKKTALGPGVFLTTMFHFTDRNDRPLARMLHRVLKFKPDPMTARPATSRSTAALALRPRPNLTHDNAFYFEAARGHRLLIQRCTGCLRLRHPPTAACAQCGSLEWDSIESCGQGSLFSFTVVHAPVVAPFRPPYVVGVVELAEGTRVVANIVEVDPKAVAIGMLLEVGFMECDALLTLPVFRPRATLPVVMRGSERAIGWPAAADTCLPRTVTAAEAVPGARLAPLEIPLTRSFIVAAAIATRDYQEVHHDPDIARARGSDDVFLNILSTNGLVGRFVTDAFGPNAQLLRIAIKLGASSYPGDTLTLSGSVVAASSEAAGHRVLVAVRGTNRRGEHVSGEVALALPGAAEASA